MKKRKSILDRLSFFKSIDSLIDKSARYPYNEPIKTLQNNGDEMKKILRWLMGILLATILFGSLLLGSFIYLTKYKMTTIDRSISPNGVYTLEFKSVGEPDWPFGDSHAQIILKKRKAVIDKTKIAIANDGKSLSKANWSVDWKQAYVIVTIVGEEQPEQSVTLHFEEKTNTAL